MLSYHAYMHIHMSPTLLALKYLMPKAHAKMVHRAYVFLSALHFWISGGSAAADKVTRHSHLQLQCSHLLTLTHSATLSHLAWSPKPRGSKYTIFEVCGPKHHTLNGFWDKSPYILGTWTLWETKAQCKSKTAPRPRPKFDQRLHSERSLRVS